MIGSARRLLPFFAVASALAVCACTTPTSASAPGSSSASTPTAARDRAAIDASTAEFIDGIAQAERRTRYVQTKFMTVDKGVKVTEVNTFDVGTTPPTLHSVVDFGPARRIETLVQPDGNVYVRGMIVKAPQTWILLRRNGTDRLSLKYAQVARGYRTVAGLSPSRRLAQWVLVDGYSQVPADLSGGDFLKLYKARIDVPATLASKGHALPEAEGLSAVHQADASLLISIDPTGLPDHIQLHLDELLDTWVTAVKPGHHFDVPPASSIATAADTASL